MSNRVNVIFSKDENGDYVYCQELPGCHSQGESFEEAKTNIKEAAALYLETMTKDEITEAFNKESYTASLEVEVG
jgi:predicted RNase H-like HicB family nuclease